MLKGNVKVTGTKLDGIITEMKNFDIEMQGYVERLVILARVFVKERLQAYLGDSSRHIDVTIRPNGFGYSVMIDPVDDVGVFMFEGTEPHEITSQAPMPIGNGQYVTVVQHPGTESKFELIEKAVFEGFAAAFGAT